MGLYVLLICVCSKWGYHQAIPFLLMYLSEIVVDDFGSNVQFHPVWFPFYPVGD
jgi:hypothetical protein